MKINLQFNYLSENKVGIVMAVLLTTFMVLSSMSIATSVSQDPLLTDSAISIDQSHAIDLGSAADYVIMAKTGISTTGSTNIVGNLGVSPIGSTAVTGFGLIQDSSGQFATSSLVTGNIYASDYTDPTPSLLTTAVSDMETAYTAAAGRTLPDQSELGAGEIGGLTLVPGLYKWSSAVTISTDVTLDGNSTDVWIFQIAETLQISSDVSVQLTGGADVENIFWQVGGQVTLDTTSVFNGIILGKTSIVMNTGATLYGRALAQSAVTMDANSVSVPVDSTDTTAPTVSSTSPANATTDVSVNSKLSVTFSEPIELSTITASTFKVYIGTTPVDGTVAYVSSTATFTPTVDLTANTVYTANITTGVKDKVGNSLASNYTWNFTTGEASDTTAPTVSSTSPANDAIDVAVGNSLTATFSEAMDPVTVSSSTFVIYDGGTNVAGTVNYLDATATFIPAVDLTTDTVYTVNITTGVMDLADNPLASNYTWSFTTSSEQVDDTTSDTTDDTSDETTSDTTDDTETTEESFLSFTGYLLASLVLLAVPVLRRQK